jgi:hypothetical protein
MASACSAGWRRCAKPSGTAADATAPPLSRFAVTGLRHRALLLLACGALAAPQAAVAQAPDPTPSARELHDEYPLRPTPAREVALASAQPTPTATADPSGGSGPSSRATLQGAIVAVVIVLGFATGFALSVRAGRRPKAGPDYGAEPAPAAPANGLEPPATRRAWTAEIEWAPAASGACFCVVATPVKGGETCVLAESAQLEWPPSGAAAVAAMTAAADDLEARLLAAGWRPLPRGDAWYARRFGWEPSRGRFDRGRPEGPRRPDRASPLPTEAGGAR